MDDYYQEDPVELTENLLDLWYSSIDLDMFEDEYQ